MTFRVENFAAQDNASRSQQQWSYITANLYHDQFRDGQEPRTLASNDQQGEQKKAMPKQEVKPGSKDQPTDEKRGDRNLPNLTLTDDSINKKSSTPEERQARLEVANAQLQLAQKRLAKEQRALDKEKDDLAQEQIEDAQELQRRSQEMSNAQEDRERLRAEREQQSKREADQADQNQVMPTHNNTGQQKSSSLGGMPQQGSMPQQGDMQSGTQTGSEARARSSNDQPGEQEKTMLKQEVRDGLRDQPDKKQPGDENLPFNEDASNKGKPLIPKDETPEERQVRLELTNVQRQLADVRSEREQLADEKEKYEGTMKGARNAQNAQFRGMEMANAQEDRERLRVEKEQQAKREAEQADRNQVMPTHNNTGQQKGSSSGGGMPQQGSIPQGGMQPGAQPGSGTP